MKKKLVSLLSILACIFSFFLFTCTECNSDNEESNCGEHKTHKEVWTTDNFLPIYLEEYYRRDGDSAIYTFTIPSRENVCPYEHVDVRFFVSVNWPNEFVFTGRFKAEILYGVLYSYILSSKHWQTIDKENIVEYEAKVNFGIKPSAGDNPGWYKPYYEFWILSSGVEQTDHENFKATFRGITIECEHYEYK